MWLSSGYPGDIADLWSSTDGVSWIRVLAETPYPVYSSLAVYNGKLWAVGGSVWSSDDGVHWIEVLDSDHRPFPWSTSLLVSAGRMWALGSGPEVWSSTDGANWTCATTAAPYGDRAAPAVAAFGGKLWLIGGSTPAPGQGFSNPNGYPDLQMNNDVWSSTDGATWTRVMEHAPWKGRMWFSAQSYAGRLWIIGGYNNDDYENLGDTWTTTDGVNWQQVALSESFWSPRHAATTWTFDGSLWLAAGNSWPFQNDVWKLNAAPMASTTITQAASPNPAIEDQLVAFTASVEPASATGTVTFREGTTEIATMPVLLGTSTFTTSALPAGNHLIVAAYSGDEDYFASESSISVEIVPLRLTPPTNVAATAISSSQVRVTWTGVPNAVSYRIYRNGSLAGASLTTEFRDSPLTANTAYLYLVRAVDAANRVGPASGADVATTILFSDDPIVPGSTTVRASHFTELRTAVDALRACAGMPRGAYSELTPATTIAARHVTELRANLDASRAALGLPAITYTDPSLEPGGTIKAVHIEQLRSALK